MPLNVRLIEESDIDGFRAALGSVVSERKYLLTLEIPAYKSVAAFIRNSIKHRHAQYVAEIDNTIVGWADIIPKNKQSQAHSGELGMGVIAGHRGQGIGKTLLARVIAHSWDIGLKRLELEVFASNRTAIALYTQHGFEHEGTKRGACRIDGIYEDIHIMARCRI